MKTTRRVILTTSGRLQHYNLKGTPKQLKKRGYHYNKSIRAWWHEKNMVPKTTKTKKAGPMEWHRVQVTLNESDPNKKGKVAGLVVDVEVRKGATDKEIEEEVRRVARTRTMRHTDARVAKGITALLSNKHGSCHDYDSEDLIWGRQKIKKEKVKDWQWF